MTAKTLTKGVQYAHDCKTCADTAAARGRVYHPEVYAENLTEIKDSDVYICPAGHKVPALEAIKEVA